MLMEKPEFENWEKTRKQGAVKYSLLTAFYGFILCFFCYFFGNAYVNRERLNLYLDQFVFDWKLNLITSIISWVMMVLLMLGFYIFNEKRYKKTLQEMENKKV